MRPLFNHSLLSSFYLYLDNQICGDAQAYQNITTGLYPQINPSVSGRVYASPFKEWVADSCISGANVPSGVWTRSGQFLTRDSGIVIDFINGRVISPYNWGQLSGSFSRKEYNIYTSTEGQVNWWLENVLSTNKNIAYTPTGMPPGYFAAPCMILTNTNETNNAWALGGLDDTRNTIRAYIISNSYYQQEGISSFARDLARNWFSLVSYSNVPYNSSGDLKTGYYCYPDLCSQFGVAGCYIENVHNVRLDQKVNNATSFSITLAEFDISTIRQPRVSK